MWSFLLWAVCFNAVCGKSVFDSMQEEWAAFKSKFDKIYETEEEEGLRFVNFIKNAQRIKIHNENPGISFMLKMNKYGDILNEEFANIMNGFNRTFAYPQKENNYIPFVNDGLPESVDWRKDGAVTEVKDQGNCGSCWAFSTTGALEGQRFRIFKKLVSLSEQNLIDCTRRYGNAGCSGGLMDFAYRYVIDNKGIDTEKSYPYKSQSRICKYNPRTKGATASGYINLPPGDENSLQEAVANIGPISVAVDASLPSFQFYSSGIYDDIFCQSNVLNHGMLVVGYGTEDEVDYWIVKNSWGSKWGEGGYIRIKRNADNLCGIATSATYPLV